MKIFSWNVNGIRSIIQKGALQKLVAEENPDILCMQEVRATPQAIQAVSTKAGTDFSDYHEYWDPAERPGYSGTGMFSKLEPSSTSDILPVKHDFSDQYGDPLKEGRVQTAEFERFYLVNTYSPNAKPDLSRLALRDKEWDPAMLAYLKSLKEKKPVVVCGDFNVAHEPIDLARPASNTHSAGFTPEERKGIDNLIAAGFVDTFRALHPDEVKYTWWSHWAHARANNVGWRIDYFFISEDLMPHLKAAKIFDQITGSDHCPISIELEF